MRYFIYRISHEDESLGAYIGKTNNLRLRFNNHRQNCKKQKAIPVYSVINANGGYDNWKKEVIEEVETEDKKVVRAREQYWIDNTQNKLNKRNAKDFDLNAYMKNYMKNWYEKNKDKKKNYYQENREKRLAYQREYFEKKKSNNNINDCANNEIPSED